MMHSGRGAGGDAGRDVGGWSVASHLGCGGGGRGVREGGGGGVVLTGRGRDRAAKDLIL